MTCANKPLSAGLLLLAVFAGAAGAASCKDASEIISNNMRLVAGSGDTLWVASAGDQGWSVNYTATYGDRWWGYALGCLDLSVTDLSFGGSTAAVILNPPDSEYSRIVPSTIWYYSHATRKYASFSLRWPDTVFMADSVADVHAADIVYAGGDFYIACRNGGLVRWNLSSGTRRACFPGKGAWFDPAQFKPDTAIFGKKPTAVAAVDTIFLDGSTRIVAVTAPRIWLYKPADSSWDSASVTTAMADRTVDFTGFVSAFVNNFVSPPLLYAYGGVKRPGSDSVRLELFRYRLSERRWVPFLRNAPRAAAPAPRSWLYVLFGANQIAAYRDSGNDSGGFSTADPAPAITEADFYKRLVAEKGIDKPANLWDVSFITQNGHADTIGTLCIASSNGLFLSRGEIPGVSRNEFQKPLRRDRVIRAGLAETYARPGIITDDPYYPERGRTEFVYKLSRDASVTIRVYDYNMQLVKTVVTGEPRRASTLSGHSTDSQRDVWDGTTTSGRPVAPGVYYYKITADSGERSFGKIVVAKGLSP